MTFRKQYQEKLDEIRADVIRMGNRANEMVRMAEEALLNGDTMAASQVIKLDDEVDDLERQILTKAIVVVMQESPVAADLRFLMSTVGILGEIEKVGDDAVKLARRATKLSGKFPFELKVALQELGEQARSAFMHALRVYSEFDAAVANEVIKSDEQIDKNYRKARDRVFDLIQKNPADTADLVRTIEAFHALEHVADHAVAIAVRAQMVYEPSGSSSSGFN